MTKNSNKTTNDPMITVQMPRQAWRGLLTWAEELGGVDPGDLAAEILTEFIHQRQAQTRHSVVSKAHELKGGEQGLGLFELVISAETTGVRTSKLSFGEIQERASGQASRSDFLKNLSA